MSRGSRFRCPPPKTPVCKRLLPGCGAGKFLRHSARKPLMSQGESGSEAREEEIPLKEPVTGQGRSRMAPGGARCGGRFPHMIAPTRGERRRRTLMSVRGGHAGNFRWHWVGTCPEAVPFLWAGDRPRRDPGATRRDGPAIETGPVYHSSTKSRDLQTIAVGADMLIEDKESVEIHRISTRTLLKALGKAKRSRKTYKPRGRVSIHGRLPSQIFPSRIGIKADYD